MKTLIKICSVLIALCCIAGLFASCENKQVIRYGTYYLTDSEDSYVVLSDETILFHNVDFSDIEEDIFYCFGASIDVAEILVGEQTYDKNKTFDKIYVQIYDDLFLTLRYDSSKKQLSMTGQKYILQES